LQACDHNDQSGVKSAMYSRKAQFHYGRDRGPRKIVELDAGAEVTRLQDRIRMMNLFDTYE
jgi:hypothetical protein